MESPVPPALRFRLQLAARVAVILGLALLGGWILRGFLPALGWAVILAVATWPLLRRLRAGRAAPSRLLLPAGATLAVAVVFLLPLAVTAVELGHEARAALHWVARARAEGAAVPAWVSSLPLLGPEASAWWTQALSAPDAGAGFLHRLSEAELIGLGRSFGGAVARRAVLFAVTLLALFFLFRDGEALAAQAQRVADRLLGPGTERLSRQAVASVRGTVSGLVLVGLGEGLLLGIAYAVAGVPHPVMLGALTAIAAMVPFAAPLVFGAAALLLLAQGAAGAAVGILAFGTAVLFLADHLIRPALIGGATRLPFVWVLLGILGGVEGFGLLGLFLGPAVMAVLVMLWRDAAGDGAAP
ncbi:AI-2E family transporter [Roseomonas nepalensis]|uniref:AI-2E family transporter n=1 Tax=Muricoccus nepalensis TaxID=1854500 RepID=A0A502FSA8_9PROT|nr:AI-2E family transporter [Roseomonas nepalensis]TPG52345.1 AI-2E family transporter [Roseomonas nepalensis]